MMTFAAVLCSATFANDPISSKLANIIVTFDKNGNITNTSKWQ